MEQTDKGCVWHFFKRDDLDYDEGPNDPMLDRYKKDPYNSIVRESLQNAIDAQKDPSQCVQVSFSVGSLPGDSGSFLGLKEHIKACIDSNSVKAKERFGPMLDVLNSSLFYLKISDYNTIGMEYRKGDKDCPFYCFVRSKGNSSKRDESAGGSYGFGKAACFGLSPINTILVSTKTLDGNHFFEGVSMLCGHSLNGQKYSPVGYFDNNDGEPITAPDQIPYGLKRDEPGTDIYVIGFGDLNMALDLLLSKDCDKMDAIRKYALQNFWPAIYWKKLELNIGGCQIFDRFKDGETLNDVNLHEYLEKYFEDENDRSKKGLGKFNPRPYIRAIESEDHHFFEKELELLGKCRLYILKNKDGNDSIAQMRSPLMLIKPYRPGTSYGYDGVFVCDSAEGNELLRKIENAEHDEWDPRDWRDEKGKVVNDGQRAIDNIKSFVKECVASVFADQDSTILDIAGLDEYLYIPTISEAVSLTARRLPIDGASTASSIPSSSLEPSEKEKPHERKSIGKVLRATLSSMTFSKSRGGGLLGGNGSGKRKTKGGGAVSSHKINSRFSEDDKGHRGTFYESLPVKYRSFALVKDNQIVHRLIVYSDHAVTKGRIDLACGADGDNLSLNIKSCSKGVVNGNSIKELNIEQGRNEFDVVFFDNMKHAVKIEAYENI